MQWARECGKWLLCVIMAACTTLAVICLPGWVCKNGGMTMREIAAVCLEMLSAHKIWAVCLCLGLGATYRRYVLGAAFSWRAAALSWLWSLLMSIGWMTEKADRLWVFLTEPGHGMLPVFLLVGAWPGLYALVRGLDMGLDGSGLQSEKGKMRWTAAGRAAVLLLCWAPYLIIAFPGSVEADFGPALLSFYGEAAFSSQMPLFVTLLFGGTVRAFDMLGIPMAGVALYNIAQMTALAFIVGTMLQMMQKNGISGRAVMAAMAIYALLPIFPLYAMTASKDNLFSICVMAALLHLCRAILEGERAFSAKWRYAALGVSLALVGVVRNAGIYLVPVIGAAMLLACRARWKPLLAAFAAAGILLGMWYGAVVPQFGVQPGGTLENMSLMLQQTARYARDYGEDITDGEKEAIGQVIAYEAAVKSYEPGISDPVKNSLDDQVTHAQKAAYRKAWARQLLRHPDAYVEAAAHMVSGYLSPAVPCVHRNYLQLGIFYSAQKAFEKLKIPVSSLFKDRLGNLYYKMKRLGQIPVVGWFLRAGTYMWIVMYLIHAVLRKRRFREGILLIPVAALALSCLLTPVNGYLRYMLPVVYICPAAWLVCGAMRKNEKAEGESGMALEN